MSIGLFIVSGIAFVLVCGAIIVIIGFRATRKCPRCKHWKETREIATIQNILLPRLCFYIKKYKCGKCGYVWDVKY